ncbi:MAG: hydantoinase/oxoprolinase family protein [Spirosomataceae bacterium]
MRPFCRISVAKGFDPKDYPLLTFGGAGGLHGCQLAEILGINTVILPFDAGLLSAYGMGQARTERLVSQQILRDFEDFEKDCQYTPKYYQARHTAFEARGCSKYRY